MSELIKDVNSLLPIGAALIGIVVYFHQKIQALNDRLHELQVSNMDKFATKDDVHRVELAIDRIADKIDKLGGLK